MFKSKKNILLTVILGIAIFLRFYNLNWGTPYPFHPDERNMADAITRMKFPDLNPHFFAYGQFPLFLVYFTGTLVNSLSSSYHHITISSSLTVSFPQAILLLRFYSALSQTLLIYIVYLISKKIFSGKNTLYSPAVASAKAGLILYTSTATIFMPGLIQSAHFGTTESLLTLFLFTTIYFSIKIAENSAKWFDYLFLILTLGFSLGTKLTALLYFPIPIFAFFLSTFSPTSHFSIPLPNSIFQLLIYRFIKLIKILAISLFMVFASLIISFLVSPYNIWEYQNTISTLNYETSVANGQSQVFYTRQFINTTPFLFQFTKIFPYAVGPLLMIIGIVGFFIMVLEIFFRVFSRKVSRGFARNQDSKQLAIILFSFLVYFIPNAVLFTKWTRFMAPIFPFFAIFSAYFLSKIYPCFLSFFKNSKFAYLKFVYLFVICLFAYLLIYPGLIFFYQVYYRKDIRFTASHWIYQNIPSNSHILSETGNVIDIPVSLPSKDGSSLKTRPLFPVSFDFYHLDENPALLDQLINELEKSDYIFVPSRRIFANHMRLANKYPLTAKYYNLLFSEKLGFVKMKEFNRLNDELAEETWSVFDHPKIRIYKKVRSFTKDYYFNLFKINS